MELEKAKQIGNEVLEKIRPCINQGEIAGSIRRKKKEVHDIDIVIDPKKDFMAMTNIKEILKGYGRFELDGEKLVRFITKDEVQIEVYIAHVNYESLLLSGCN